VSFWVSLDGYSCDEGTELSDAMERISDDEHEAHFASGLRRAGTHIMGRGTYLGMSAFWPGSDHPFAAPMNDIPKVVFSATLQTAGWSEARIARGGMAREIARLKEEPGGEIVAHGGVRFVQSLTRLGLVDEYA
jgi:dihydrofolate reductase